MTSPETEETNRCYCIVETEKADWVVREIEMSEVLWGSIWSIEQLEIDLLITDYL